MRWNDNRIILFGLSTAILFYLFVLKTAETTIEVLSGGILFLGYLIIVALVAEQARLDLLPKGMSLKEAGYGDKKYKYLDQAYGDSG